MNGTILDFDVTMEAIFLTLIGKGYGV